MNFVHIFERYRQEYEHRFYSSISYNQRHAMATILSCRSCRSGLTAKCNLIASTAIITPKLIIPAAIGSATAASITILLSGLIDRLASYFPVTIFLVTFILPRQLRSLANHNQSCIYSILFDCAVSTLRDFVANDKSLSANAGMTAVLHTHSRRLNFHPHIHIVIPAGGRLPETAFKQELKHITRRCPGISIESRLIRLREYLQGWMSHYGCGLKYDDARELWCKIHHPATAR